MMPTDLARALAVATRTFSVAIRADVAETLERLGVTEPQWDALWALDPAAEAPTMSQFAGRLGLDPSTITFLVKRLAASGLIQLLPDPKDKRSKSVVLTVKGMKARATVLNAYATASPIQNLDARQQGELLELLRRAAPAPAEESVDEAPRAAAR